MGQSMTPAAQLSPGRLPPEATVNQSGSARVYRVTHDNTGWYESESEPGVFDVRHKLEYAVGSGANGLTFLVRRDNYLFQAPLSYYSKINKWDFSPGYEHAEFGFSRVVPEQCINCHAGRSAPVPSRSGAYLDPPFEELSVGCENCHGPGESHVRSQGRQRNSIVNPSHLPARLAENICINCHQTGDARQLQPGKQYLDFRPGQWLFDTAVIFKLPKTEAAERESDLLEHFSGMQSSRCFRQSAGKLTCASCHDPHVQPRGSEVVAYYRAKCLACHTDKSCSLPLPVRLGKTPSNDCVGCHMKKRDVMQISHSALTNHRIPARDGEAVPASAEHETGGLIILNPPGSGEPDLKKTVLLRAYSEVGAQHPEYEQRYMNLLDDLNRTQPQEPLVQAALGHRLIVQGKTEEALEHLKQALPLGESTVYLDLAQVCVKLGQTNDAIEYLKAGAAIDPFNPSLQKMLILQYIYAHQYDEARNNMRQYVDSFPEDSFMRNLLARVEH